MGVFVRLNNINCDNDFTVGYCSSGYTGDYTTVGTYSGGTTSVEISNLLENTKYYIKIVDTTTQQYIIQTIKTHDPECFLCATPTPTPTSTPTPTPTLTPTATPTPTPTLTPTPTPTPTLTPTPTPTPCECTYFGVSIEQSYFDGATGNTDPSQDNKVYVDYATCPSGLSINTVTYTSGGTYNDSFCTNYLLVEGYPNMYYYLNNVKTYITPNGSYVFDSAVCCSGSTDCSLTGATAVYYVEPTPTPTPTPTLTPTPTPTSVTFSYYTADEYTCDGIGGCTVSITGQTVAVTDPNTLTIGVYYPQVGTSTPRTSVWFITGSASTPPGAVPIMSHSEGSLSCGIICDGA